MLEILESIFGTYTPVVDPETGFIVAGWSGLDIPYIAGVFLFGIVLFSFFRLLGVILKGD